MQSTLQEFDNLSVEYYQVIKEGTAYGYRSGMHHSILLHLDNGRMCLVEKVNPNFQRNPWTTRGDVLITHNQDEIEERLCKADFTGDDERPRVRSAQAIMARVIREQDGHYFLIGDNCQDFVRYMVLVMKGRI